MWKWLDSDLDDVHEGFDEVRVVVRGGTAADHLSADLFTDLKKVNDALRAVVVVRVLAF